MFGPTPDKGLLDNYSVQNWFEGDAVPRKTNASEAFADEDGHPVAARHHAVVVAGRLADQVVPRHLRLVPHQHQPTGA